MASFLDSAGVTRLVTKLKTILPSRPPPSQATASPTASPPSQSRAPDKPYQPHPSAATPSRSPREPASRQCATSAPHRPPSRSPTSPAPRSSSSTSPPPPILPGRSSGSISSIPTSRADTASTVDASSRARRPAPSPSEASPPSRGPSRSRPHRSIIHTLHQWQERTIPGQGLRPVAAHLGLVNDNNKTITRKYNYSSLLIHKTVWQSISIPQA